MISHIIHGHTEGAEFLAFSTTRGIQLKHQPMCAILLTASTPCSTVSVTANIRLATEFQTEHLASSLSGSVLSVCACVVCNWRRR